ncbi:hypothetical protein J3Q64DRAFT_1751672 [Phycomyces blakesleeanus]|uniref:Uncharacterized protein n=2 Tax=Phycomyces blakesleeanus TaxID=4837 RepID=A0A163DPQ2_PHYB8|nr:hypothetical protein PHYBLDRAFT_65334 [Phycomyces blakesleeanus NRRL 1555(-)]OAD72740.1 hypothetical protein PHYBLDRAFT_65334 [Phycomyces blakesleeanus NRRL 1555(-)]|eukprot:XP_018290780.1 hypothetical protein PHYBLDRAFT_65334 [Phycomyces blakesleeanus NRRL 1555(-)]
MPTNKDLVQTVATGAGISAVTGATVGATVAVLTNSPVRTFAISTGLNCGVFGATFFAVRESFLTYQRSKNPLYGLKDSQTRDVDDLVSSTMAGVTTGGLLSAAYRGSRGVIPGSIMFGTFCAGTQLLYSAANRWRQDKILEKESGNEVVAKSIWEYIKMPSWSPIRQLSNDEYNEILDNQLKALEEEMRVIEKELKEKRVQ